MLNLDKLNTDFDINNIDLKEIPRFLTKNQKIVAVVLVVGALVMLGGAFNDYSAKNKSIHAQMTQEQGKIEIIKARDKAIQDFNNYKTSVPKELNVFDLITLIQDYAKLCNTTIVSYTPNQPKDSGTYGSITVRFDVLSDDFKSMILFLRKIEKSNFPISLNTWIGHEGDDGKISFTTEIRAVNVHP